VPVDPDGCDAVVALHADGDYKPAVDAMRGLLDRGVVCSLAADAAFEAARETLGAADEFVRLGLEHRERGEQEAARRSFEEALAVYPKYYWVEALERTLTSEDEALVPDLHQKAAELRARGRIEEALAILEEAQALAPTETETAASISELRTEVAFRHLAAAKREADEGRLDQAAESVLQAIDARPVVEPARLRVVEDARNLGLSLFSAGELIKARDLWHAALALDETNPTLVQYLSEVEARLERLAAIQMTGDS
jgi:tetratricopeptide (TPR) repeat protein